MTAAQRAPAGFTDVHEIIPAAELADIAERYARAGGGDVGTANGRASYDVRAAPAGTSR